MTSLVPQVKPTLTEQQRTAIAGELEELISCWATKRMGALPSNFEMVALSIVIVERC